MNGEEVGVIYVAATMYMHTNYLRFQQIVLLLTAKKDVKKQSRQELRV
jgi:hypothetical protein